MKVSDGGYRRKLAQFKRDTMQRVLVRRRQSYLIKLEFPVNDNFTRHGQNCPEAVSPAQQQITN